MHDHLSHLLITALPFVAITLLVLWRNRSFGLIRNGLLVIVLLVVTLQTVPVHYLHAAHAQDLQTYQCCVPAPVMIAASFEVITLLLSHVSHYSYAEYRADFLPNLILSGRSPPAV